MNTIKNKSLPKRAVFGGISSKSLLVAGLALAALCSGNLQAQVTLDPAWRVTPDTTKPGFKWNYFQNNDSNNKANNNARTEADLAGQVTDSTGALLENLGDPSSFYCDCPGADPAVRILGLGR